MTGWRFSLLAALLCAVASPFSATAQFVRESARDIPLAYDVDIVVVGGSTGAVAAAVAARKNGATVFLAAPRPYLGEDVCATQRLWLEEDEAPQTPLAQALFVTNPLSPLVGKGLSFTYETSIPAAGRHPDSKRNPLLTNGRWDNAPSHSVEYGGDVTVIADLGKAIGLSKVHALAFQRNDDFEVDSVTISLSADKRTWKKIDEVWNVQRGKGAFEDDVILLGAEVEGAARYVKLEFAKGPKSQRILLAEIIIEPAKNAPPEPTKRIERVPPTPMQIKRALDHALLDAGVKFLYGCYPTEVLRDAQGQPAGIVMANRSGRQAVRAKVIIDATTRATVARLAGAKFTPYPAGPQTFKRIVVGGEVENKSGLPTRQVPTPIARAGNPKARAASATEYTLTLPMPGASAAAFALAEQAARDQTWQPGQLDASEILFQVPPDTMYGLDQTNDPWPGAAKIPLEVFRPAGVQRLYVLGGCAAVSRAAAERLLRPLELLAVGARIGEAAANEAQKIDALKSVQVAGGNGRASGKGDVKEILEGVRPFQKGPATIPSPARALPVLGEYDVVVIGGGTGGAPAGIGAARRGAKTLVVEWLHGLGGVGTLGFIAKYYYGNRTGFTAEVTKGAPQERDGWDIQQKMEWYRAELRKAGADVWFWSLGCGAYVEYDDVENGAVKGVVVVTPFGRGVVLAKTVIDSTGNCDIAAAAGAQCVYTDGTSVAVQGAGMPHFSPGAGYTNTDYTFTADDDLVDRWRTFVMGREKFSDKYDLGQLIDTRERRRIVGDVTISPLDILNHRTYPDTIGLSASNFDSHGYTIHPVFALRAPDKKNIFANTPLRALLPQGLDGIMVTGLGISAHRDAMPILRMQPDIQNQGYAAGYAAAMAAKAGVPIRQVDVKALQQHLVEVGNVPESVLTDKDNYPLSEEAIDQAVTGAATGLAGLEILLTHQKEAAPLLRKAYAAATTDAARLVYAQILGMQGDATGAKTLIEAVKQVKWDRGWSFKGMGQFGANLSPTDVRIIALGQSGAKGALEPILERLDELTPASELSHYRAVGMALEALSDPRAAAPLAKLLQQPGVMGHAFLNVDDPRKHPIPNNPDETRNQALREIFLARALYRCGDRDGLAKKILEQYAGDLRGHYARHAHAILHGPPAPAKIKPR